MRKYMLALVLMLVVGFIVVSCNKDNESPTSPGVSSGTLDEQTSDENSPELLSQFGWSSWNNKNVKAGSYHEVRFAPGRKGTHYIEFCNQSNIYNGGKMQSCWRKGSGSWNCWANSDVLSRSRQQKLYSGSKDINYRFRFYAQGNYQYVRFYWRFWTD